MRHPLVLGEPGDPRLLLVALPRRKDHRERPADHLVGGVAEDALGPAVPGGDLALERAAHDRVLGVGDDGRQPRPQRVGGLALADVAHHHAALAATAADEDAGGELGLEGGAVAPHQGHLAAEAPGALPLGERFGRAGVGAVDQARGLPLAQLFQGEAEELAGGGVGPGDRLLAVELGEEDAVVAVLHHRAEPQVLVPARGGERIELGDALLHRAVELAGEVLELLPALAAGEDQPGVVQRQGGAGGQILGHLYLLVGEGRLFPEAGKKQPPQDGAARDQGYAQQLSEALALELLELGRGEVPERAVRPDRDAHRLALEEDLRPDARVLGLCGELPHRGNRGAQLRVHVEGDGRIEQLPVG